MWRKIPAPTTRAIRAAFCWIDALCRSLHDGADSRLNRGERMQTLTTTFGSIGLCLALAAGCGGSKNDAASPANEAPAPEAPAAASAAPAAGAPKVIEVSLQPKS